MASKDNKVALALLSRAHSPETTSRIYTTKVATRPLHIKPTEPSNAQHVRRLTRQRQLAARKKTLKPAPLSSRQRRALGLHDTDPATASYAVYAPLHAMWTAYILEVLGPKCMPVGPGTAAKLCSADYHGAEVEVVRSRCVSRVGVRGIVVRDLRSVFEIVTRGDGVKVLPKEHTVFRFRVPRPVEGETAAEGEGKELVFELHGDQFMYRAAERANKKFKQKFLPDL